MGETLMARKLLQVYPQLPDGPGAMEFLDLASQIGATGLTTRHRWPNETEEDLGQVVWLREGQRFRVRPGGLREGVRSAVPGRPARGGRAAGRRARPRGCQRQLVSPAGAQR